MNLKLIQKGKHLLISGIVASICLWTVAATAQQTRPAPQTRPAKPAQTTPATPLSDAQISAMVEALRKAAPPNRAKLNRRFLSYYCSFLVSVDRFAGKKYLP